MLWKAAVGSYSAEAQHNLKDKYGGKKGFAYAFKTDKVRLMQAYLGRGRGRSCLRLCCGCAAPPTCPAAAEPACRHMPHPARWLLLSSLQPHADCDWVLYSSAYLCGNATARVNAPQANPFEARASASPAVTALRPWVMLAGLGSAGRGAHACHAPLQAPASQDEGWHLGENCTVYTVLVAGFPFLAMVRVGPHLRARAAAGLGGRMPASVAASLRRMRPYADRPAPRPELLLGPHPQTLPRALLPPYCRSSPPKT